MPTTAEVRRQIEAIRSANTKAAPAYQQMAQYIRSNNISPNVVAAAMGMDTGTVNSLLEQYGPAQASTPAPATPPQSYSYASAGDSIPEIRSYIAGVMSDPNMDGMSKVGMITQWANERGYTADDIANNSDLSLDYINQELSRPSVMNAGYGLTGPQQAPAQPGGGPMPAPASGAPGPGAPAPVNTGQPGGMTTGNFGLSGAENAITTGGLMGLDILNNTSGAVNSMYDEAAAGLSPYASQGEGAFNLQAAYSGAQGPEAQQQAFDNYMMSPGVRFAQGEAERALIRNAAATGGNAQGGNVLRDLTKLAAGTFAQDFGNQFNRLGQVSGMGLNAAGTQANLRAQQGGLTANLGQFGAGIPVNAGNAIGGYRYQAGRDIASGIQDTTRGLATLANQQGAGLTDIIGQGATNINSLLQLSTQGDAQAKEQLATILANLGAQSGSQYSSVPIIPNATSNYLGQIGQVAGGIGGLMYGLQPPGGTTTVT